ncbi:MAG: hypothetical protein AB7P02_09395 [Alphaproteobacteria bacterium]
MEALRATPTPPVVASFFAPRYERWPGCDYDRLLLLLDASCRRLGLRHVVISDERRPAPLETARFNLPENLMRACLDGQRQFLAATSGPVLLVGADCLLTADPTPFMNGDVTITIGPFADCEMNTWMVWCADGPRCAPVWQRALDLRPQEWGDDQTCLYAAIQSSDLAVWRVACQAHNWAPEGPLDRAGWPTVVHFRGMRKPWMAGWAKAHLGIAHPANG